MLSSVNWLAMLAAASLYSTDSRVTAPGRAHPASRRGKTPMSRYAVHRSRARGGGGRGAKNEAPEKQPEQVVVLDSHQDTIARSLLTSRVGNEKSLGISERSEERRVG